MDLAKDLDLCCGCGACVNICPKEAIVLKENEEGFLYPQVDNDKCISCHLCEKSCFFVSGIKKTTYDNFSHLAYAVQASQDEIRMKSQSGGMFYLISTYILNENGIVYGCKLNENFDVVHSRASTKEQRDLMCGSKYVQSDTNNVYSQVKNDLLNNKIVLFTGTPCQVEGLIKYLATIKESHKDNLYLVDIVCHGVSSPKIWKEYLNEISSQYNERPIKVKFRDKSFGWRGCVSSFEFQKEKYISSDYGRIFFNHGAMRMTCFSCKFTNLERVSDITIGDCWGIEKNNPKFDDNKGTSLVIINTARGKKIFEKIKNDAIIVKIDINKYLQPQLREPIVYDQENRKSFWLTYNNRGIKGIINQYGHLKFSKKVKIFLGRVKIINKAYNFIKKHL